MTDITDPLAEIVIALRQGAAIAEDMSTGDSPPDCIDVVAACIGSAIQHAQLYCDSHPASQSTHAPTGAA